MPERKFSLPLVLEVCGGAALVALLALAAYPFADGWRERASLEARFTALDAHCAPSPPGRLDIAPELLLRLSHLEGSLASWQSVGGCGVGGGGPSSAGGGVKWVGRNVSGGLVDTQVLASTSILDDGLASVANTRIGTGVVGKWVFAVNAPFVHKVQDVNVLGEDKTATIFGWGDLGLEVGRKLGITNATLATLSVATPTGAHDAIREGILLPQQAQLGAGVWSGSLSVDHTIDRIWGLMIVGGSLSYGGGENSIQDYRSPSGGAFGHVGYLMGPFVPAVGLSLSAKLRHDRERGKDLDDALYTASLSGSLEWSSDYLAVLVGGLAALSPDGIESWTLALGLSSSLF